MRKLTGLLAALLLTVLLNGCASTQSEYFEELTENALRRYDHITETCLDPAWRNCGILGKIAVLRFLERREEADWSAEFEYPDPDIVTAEQTMALWSQGREVLSYLQNE